VQRVLLPPLPPQDGPPHMRLPPVYFPPLGGYPGK
jgi:hypothetical protein